MSLVAVPLVRDEVNAYLKRHRLQASDTASQGASVTRPTDPKPPASEQRHDFGPSFGGDPPQMRRCKRCQKVVGWWEADYRSNETCEPSPAPPEQPARVRRIEGVVVWERNDPHPCVKVSDDPESGWVELDSLLRGLLNRSVRVTVEVLDDAPGKDGAK